MASRRRLTLQAVAFCVPFMDIVCPRCGGLAEPAGYEDARAFFLCHACDRVWATHVSLTVERTASASAPPPRVLIADDSPEMLGLLAAWLEDEGCVVIAVGSGREAQAAAVYQPDVAFVDLVLPPPDGFEVCEALTRGGGPSVILMTGMSHPDLQRVAESGALCLLRKPFDREALVEALQLGLARKRAQKPGAPAAVSA
jgi:CheY-like chemotaxis protein